MLGNEHTISVTLVNEVMTVPFKVIQYFISRLQF